MDASVEMGVPREWFDLVAVPLVVVGAGGVVANRVARRLFASGRLFVEGGEMSLESLADRGSASEIEVRCAGAPSRWFRIERDASPPATVLTFIDETERRAAAQRLEDATSRLEWTERMTATGSWGLDLVDMRPTFSRESKRILSLPLDHDPPLDTVFGLCAAHGRSMLAEAVSRAIRHGEDWDLDLPIKTAEGRERFVQAIGHASFEGERCVRLFGTLHDVTERRSRRQLRQDLELLFQTSPTCQCIVNFSGYFVAVNDRWSEILGYSKEELTSRPFIDFVHPDDVERTRVMAAEHTAVGRPVVDFDNRYRTKDGAYRWLRWYAISDVQAARIYAVATDVTDDKARALELQRLASVADRTENGVLVTDAESRIQWVNPAFTRITGYGLEEMRGKVPGHVLQGAGTAPEVVAEIRSALAEARGVQAELLNYRKNGEAFWVQLDIQPVFDGDGHVINFVAVESDVSRRKTYEAELRQARDDAQRAATLAAEANLAKSRFLANMSHEIRTPLNGILGIAELMQDTPLDDEQKGFVDTISRSGLALSTLVNDILDFSKIEANKLELDAAPYRFIDVVEWVMDMARLTADKKNIELVAAVPDDLPVLMGDEGRMRQILLNLVSNAVKFTTDGVVRVDVEGTRDGDRLGLSVSVTDTGAGIDAETLRRLFRPFTQADASTTRKFGGTGLGLSICKNLIELMGGEIRVESTLGEGSRFTFSVGQPLSATGLPRPGADVATRDLSGRTVLLVEDNPTNQLVATRMLRRLGIEVEVAHDGAEALEVAAERGFDLILMDCQMPRMDGFEATRAIRRLETPMAKVPIIALTASTLKGDEERCLAAGMTDYLAKPIRRVDLMRKLDGYLTG